jgi:hypothetical protein
VALPSVLLVPIFLGIGSTATMTAVCFGDMATGDHSRMQRSDRKSIKDCECQLVLQENSISWHTAKETRACLNTHHEFSPASLPHTV